MPAPDRRRATVIATIVAALLGLLLGWLARLWLQPTAESRARDRMGEIRERAREQTR